MSSVFRRGHLTENVFEKYANDVLSDTELRWFWISWLPGVISYGRGSEPGLDVIGSYIHSSPSTVKYMSVSSYDSGRGDWLIPSELYLTPGTWCSKYDGRKSTHRRGDSTRQSSRVGVVGVH